MTIHPRAQKEEGALWALFPTRCCATWPVSWTACPSSSWLWCPASWGRCAPLCWRREGWSPSAGRRKPIHTGEPSGEPSLWDIETKPASSSHTIWQLFLLWSSPDSVLVSLQVWEFSHLFSSVDSWHMADIPPISAHLKVCPYYEVSLHSKPVSLPSMDEKCSQKSSSLVNHFTGNRWQQFPCCTCPKKCIYGQVILHRYQECLL